jgi:S1-C subfamily serine protease
MSSDAGTARPPGNRRRRALLGAGVAAALAIAAVAYFRWGSGGPADPSAARPTPSASPTGSLTVAQVYQAVAPSVVGIRARGRNASGTGVIANVDGTILTALHVVRDATGIEVTFADGTRSAATVAGSDPANDIAALTAARLPSVVVPAILGGGAAIGDEVVAIGNQLGLAGSTTAGVVSGLGRSMDREDADDIDGLIQFDAAVNPGSSGGPLVNTRGQTIGIVVALVNPTDAGTFIGIGFAVPIGAALGAGDGDNQGPQL